MTRHRTDGLSLGFGAVFLFTAGWWLIGRVVDLRLPHLGWLLALALIVVGVTGLARALRGGQRTPVGEQPAWPEEPTD